MNLILNDWNKVREHYRRFEADILAQDRNEWGIDPYLWDNGFIFMTPIEHWLWHDIRACDAVLYPQYPIGRFIVDFANPRAKVAIECDGRAYHQDKEKDRSRDELLQSLGWKVYRISGSDCAKDSDRETGAPGPAYLFIQRICEHHGISRNSRTVDDTEWHSTGGIVEQVIRSIHGPNWSTL